MLVISVGFFGNAEIVKKCGFPVFSFYTSSKEGEGRREDKTPGLIFGSFSKLGPFFSIVFAFASVVEAAPQARPKTTAVAHTALRPSPCSSPSLNALPVPLLRQVHISAFFSSFFQLRF